MKYLIHRGLALILTIFISYLPTFLSTKPLAFKTVMENGEIIFSLIALLAICFFDVLENNLQDVTLILFSFVLVFILISIGIIAYIYQKQTPGNTYWITNLACLITTAIIYLVFYGIIASKKKRSKQ